MKTLHPNAVIARNGFYTTAKKTEPIVARAVQRAALSFRSVVDLKAVEEALQQGSSFEHKTDLVMAHLGTDGFGKHLVRHGLQENLLQSFLMGAKTGAAQIRNAPKRVAAYKKLYSVLQKDKNDSSLATSLDLTNPMVLSYLQDYIPDLIVDINDQQRAAVLQAVTSGFLDGRAIPYIARDIRNVVGLTDTMAQWVLNFRQQLETGEINGQTAPWDRRLSGSEQQQARSEFYSDVSNSDRIDSLVDRYQTSLINRRAQNIARTEVHGAQIQGQENMWGQAISDGLLDENKTKRQWLYTHDDKVREWHADIPGLNPKGVGLAEPFDTDYGPVDGPGMSGYPSFDINCRCTIYLLFEAPEESGAGVGEESDVMEGATAQVE